MRRAAERPGRRRGGAAPAHGANSPGPVPAAGDVAAAGGRGPRRSGRLVLAVGIVLAALGVAMLGRTVRPERHRVTLVTGDTGTGRETIGRWLEAVMAGRGIAVQRLPSRPFDQALADLEAGRIDLLLAPSAMDFDGFPRVREVTPLYIEALQLLVRPELVPATERTLETLRGRRVDVGPAGGAGARLAEAVLDFVGIGDGGAAVLRDNLEPRELMALLDRGDREALPDAAFVLSIVPGPLVTRLVHEAGYRLVPLPFADAFRLRGVLAEIGGSAVPVEWADISEVVIPALVYGMSPPVPERPVATLGTRLVLLANEAVPAATVGAVLDAVFTSHFARLNQPPLDESLLGHPTRLPLHAGTRAYMARNQPLVTGERVDLLSNALSIVGALGGSALFLWQWRRQQRHQARQAQFAAHLRRMADIARRVAEVEMAADLTLEPLAAAQRELLQLKTEVLDSILSGALRESEAVSALLMPVNASLEHVANLILHVREELEAQAAAQGRSIEAVWTEALAGAPAPAEGPRRPRA